VGDASYSIYLIHPLVFVVAKSATTLAPPIGRKSQLGSPAFLRDYVLVASELALL
jgi:peptidoglycan/LPS O-acetylase OafA/YrhL